MCVTVAHAVVFAGEFHDMATSPDSKTSLDQPDSSRKRAKPDSSSRLDAVMDTQPRYSVCEKDCDTPWS